MLRDSERVEEKQPRRRVGEYSNQFHVQKQKSMNFSCRLTREEEEAALHCASDGLQLDHVHGLADIHRAGHAPQGAAHVLGHLLHGEHLQQLIEDIGEAVEQRRLRGRRGTEKTPEFVSRPAKNMCMKSSRRRECRVTNVARVFLLSPLPAFTCPGSDM